MILTTVNSNAIHAIGYDRENQVLEVIFNNGGIYCYQHVPQQLFEGFVRSRSKGEFFQNHVRGVYPNWRLGRWRRRVRRASVEA